jgi:hypothetical protein
MENIDVRVINRLHNFLSLREKDTGVKPNYLSFIEVAIQEKMERYRKDGRSK